MTLIFLVSFFASWCGSCKKELPLLVKLNASLEKSKYQIVGVDIDKNLEDALKFQKDHGVNFKVINDTYGHIAGDKILIFIANILKKTLRDGDKIFRYGGEEFILILNRLDNIHCLKIASRILELINKNKLIYKGESINVTVSIGTTIYNISDTPDSMIHRADKALYRAKKDGKKFKKFSHIP